MQRGRGREPAPPRPPIEGAVAVDSRWWYWIAALPVVVAVWLVTFAWVALAVATEFGAGLLAGDPVPVAFSLSVLVAGVPLAVVGGMLPVATYMDTRAVVAAGVDWRPSPARWAAAGAGSLLSLVGAPAFACYYLYRRHRHLGVPGLEGGFNVGRRERP